MPTPLKVAAVAAVVLFGTMAIHSAAALLIGAGLIWQIARDLGFGK